MASATENESVGMIGQTLAHYKILEKLGSGGMGDVYLAEDAKLDRKVALKVLPAELAEHSDRITRFTREAKAIAALNHPNIVHVYSIEKHDNIHFITMELVKGKTLAEDLPRNGVPLARLFEIAIPLADAVAAAHDEGITHRDLKPANIMLGDDGWIKVLDFGLAKPTVGPMAPGGSSELPTAAKTEVGLILGTAEYMSPEQAEGKPLDHRTDLFSIGIVLYELATGARPFRGDTTASLLSSILKDTPSPVNDVNPEIPRELAKIIRRCLTKDPERRFQSAKDLRNELQELKAEWSSGELHEAGPSTRSAPKIAWVIAVLALVSTAIVAYIIGQSKPIDTLTRLANPVKVTSTLGVENYPTWSPEGRRLAYESRESGNADIWVTQLGGADRINLTGDHTEFDGSPSWSPDGNHLAFISSREGGGIFVIPALGGRARKVLSSSNAYRNGPRWSADGTEIAAPRYDSGNCFADIVTLANLETRSIPLPTTGLSCRDLSWSPDGRYFAYMVAPGTSPLTDTSQIWVTPVSGGEATPVTDRQTANWSPTWSEDGSKLFYASNRGGSLDLWRQTIGEDGKPQGAPARVTTGLVVRNPTFARGGKKLAYSSFRVVANVWRVPIRQDRPATWADAQQITFDEALVEELDVSSDGTRLLLSSDRSGNDDIWVMSSDGGEMEQLTTDPTPDWNPSWSPDGKEIVFYAYRSGNRDVWVMPANGGPARQLTRHESFDMYPTWSPDGTEIAFTSGRSGNDDIWAIPSEGGEPRRITTHPRVDDVHVYSPDGDWLILTAGGDGVRRLWRIPTAGGEAEPLTDERSDFPAWAPDGSTLYFQRAGNLWSLTMKDRSERAVTHLEGQRGGLGDALATDGHYLYFTWRDDVGDIWIMDVITDESS